MREKIATIKDYSFYFYRVWIGFLPMPSRLVIDLQCGFLSKSFSQFWELFGEHRAAAVSANNLKDSLTMRDVFDNFMCRWQFSAPFFVGTNFNCFLKSIRRSIPMTVAVKLTSTRRCMTCSFFGGFFVFIEERSGRMRRGHCAARPLAFPNAHS